MLRLQNPKSSGNNFKSSQSLEMGVCGLLFALCGILPSQNRVNRNPMPFCVSAKTLDKICVMLFNLIKICYHKNRFYRDIVYMIGIFLNLLETQSDKDKFAELYETYKDLMYWIALKRTNSIEDAEDCVQETFFYVAKHFEKVDEVKSKRTKCYLSTIVTGFAIDIYNKSNKINIVSTEENNDLTDLKYFENFEKVELLYVFDKMLDEESKVLLYLKYIYGYKSSEIAEIYKANDSYIRKKIQYAKDKLKKNLKEGNYQ